jgi:hypothetical protein
MPTLDDTTTLQKNVAVAANDSLVISNKDSSGSSLIQQVPAAQILNGFSHAWLFNFDSASYAVSSTQFIDNAAVVVTTAFNPSGTATIEVGIEDDDADGYIDGADLKTVAYLRGTGPLLDTPAEDAAVAVHNPTDSDTLRVTFANGSSQNLSTATTGQVVVLVNIVDTADFADIVPAQ